MLQSQIFPTAGVIEALHLTSSVCSTRNIGGQQKFKSKISPKLFRFFLFLINCGGKIDCMYIILMRPCFLKVELIGARSPPSITVTKTIESSPDWTSSKLKRAKDPFTVCCCPLQIYALNCNVPFLPIENKHVVFGCLFLSPVLYLFTGTDSNKVTKCQENINL